MMMNRVIRGVAALSLVTLVATGCGTATDAAVGAGSGAAIGAGTGYGAGKGALIGVGVGAAAGAIYDHPPQPLVRVVWASRRSPGHPSNAASSFGATIPVGHAVLRATGG